MTVDLVGSTAFKAKALQNGDQLYPEWVSRFRDFYRQFPDLLDTAYRDTKSGSSQQNTPHPGPKLWKIIGDEILFCCRIISLQHLSCCVTAFIAALEQYGLSLHGTGLDLKGAGWIAEFPAKNITLSITDGAIAFTLPDDDLPTEDFEAGADTSPHNYDFLGSSIDIGFRVAQHAKSDKFAASAELALLLAEAKDKQMFMRDFRYDGRLPLKGVNGEHPYPVVFIDTERDHGKREIRTRERLVTKEPEIAAIALRDFLTSYLAYHNFSLPSLPRNYGDASAAIEQESYQQYKRQWQEDLNGAEKQDASIQASEEAGNEKGNSGLNTPVMDFASRLTSEDARRVHLLTKQYADLLRKNSILVRESLEQHRKLFKPDKD